MMSNFSETLGTIEYIVSSDKYSWCVNFAFQIKASSQYTQQTAILKVIN